MKQSQFGPMVQNMNYYEDEVSSAVASGWTVLYKVLPKYDGPRTVPVDMRRSPWA